MTTQERIEEAQAQVDIVLGDTPPRMPQVNIALAVEQLIAIIRDQQKQIAALKARATAILEGGAI